jgi:hypothetical protein
MRGTPIWILLSILPSLALSALMVDDSLRSAHPFVGKEPPHNIARVSKSVTLSKEMEDRVKETLEGGLTNISVPEAAYIANASQKTKALFVSLYGPTAKADTIEEISLHSILSSKTMAAAQTSLATMEKESTILTEELSRLTAQWSSLEKALTPIEKNLGVLSRAIQSEKEKERAKDPKNSSNLPAMHYLETKMEEFKKQKEQLQAQKKQLEERSVPLEEKKARKEQEIFVHRELIKLREKRDLLSQTIQEEAQLHVHSIKLDSLKEKRDAFDEGEWEILVTRATVKILQQEGEHLGQKIVQESKKASSDSEAVKQLRQKRNILGIAIEKFGEIRERKRRVKRIFTLIKEKLTPTEINELILGDRAVVTGKTFFADRIVVLERLTALPPKIRQKLMQQAQRLIEPRMSGDDRASIAKVFVNFERVEDGEEFSKELSLHKVGPITPKFIKSAANAWRSGRQKFRDSLGKIRSLRLRASNEFVNNFLELPEDTREKFLNLFSKSSSPEEKEILYALAEIDNRRHLNEMDFDPIEEMEKFKNLAPKQYEAELKMILKYYKKDSYNCLILALEEKKKREKDTLRKVIMERLIKNALRITIRAAVEKELGVENLLKNRLREISELKTPNAPELKARFEQELAQKVTALTNQRFAKELKSAIDKGMRTMDTQLEQSVEEHLEEELENVHLLQIHPLLIPFEPEAVEDDVFTERKHPSEIKRQSAPPPSPQSPQRGAESGYDSSDHDLSGSEV